MLTSTMTMTRIQLSMCRSSVSGEMLHLDTSLLSQKQGNKVGKGKGKVKQTKSLTGRKAFSPEQLVSNKVTDGWEGPNVYMVAQDAIQ